MFVWIYMGVCCMCVIYSFTSPLNVWHWAFNEMSACGTFIRKYGVYLRHKGSPLTRCYDTHLLLTRTKEAARCRLHAKQNKASERPSKGTQTCNKWRFNQANEQVLRHKTLFNFLQLKWFCSHDTQRGLSCPAERLSTVHCTQYTVLCSGNPFELLPRQQQETSLCV